MEAAGKRYVAHPSRSDAFTLWGIGDLHIGSPGCDLERVKRDVEAVRADPFALWLGIGDHADYIGVGDKRFDPLHLDDGAKLNLHRLGKHFAERVRDVFRPIRHKCLGLLYGNHEARYMQHKEQGDLHSWLCAELEVPNLKYSAIFDLVFCRQKCKAPGLVAGPPAANSTCESFRVWCHHGAGSATSKGGKLNRLSTFMADWDADIFLVGHVHELTGTRVVSLGADATCTKLVERQKVGAICGSYLRTYQAGTVSYGEEKGFRPNSLGASRIVIVPDRRKILAEV